ncbi:MAG: PQQ-binding-like beta-propeller repeat protein [Planctomycetes bacterium]|nr:PQQ-binding-like beta-propeller repeat protein [Planctomycetota bacterium]
MLRIRIATFPLVPIVVLALGVGAASAQGWPNSGGNAQRNGQSPEYGPLAARQLWTGARSSIIAWQPVVAGRRVFVVRQTGFPPSGEPNGSPVVALDLDSGRELWAINVPFNTGDWTTWVLGTSDGKVYASRSGNGASVSAHIHALDQVSGATVWVSQDAVDAGAYDGVVFAPNGDLIVASFRTIWRIRASDGATVWSAARLGSVSGNCGAALFGNAVYVADAAPGGNVIKRYDLAAGALAYASPIMPGFTIQQTPMVGPDGTVYLNRVQNNAGVDFFYAFTDTGSGFVQRWSVPAQYTAGAEFGVGPDGSVSCCNPVRS